MASATTLAISAVYALPLAAAFYFYARRLGRKNQHGAQQWQAAVEAGLTEPASLHPVIDPTRCIGSGSCVKHCQEEALGIVMGKGHLVNPTVCIGHGACAASCPVEAISLVFGTAKRGIDIPFVSPSFETNIPGIFIAGELGGMGLIRKAVEQGRQAMESVARQRGDARQLDVLIVGAGPAGLSSSLAAMEKKLRFVTVEQEDSLGGTVYHYPRNKIVMTAPMQLPIVGKVKMGEISKESLLEFWYGIVQQTGLKLNFGERMESIVKNENGFTVKTSRASYDARNVLLAIGRRGTPRKLGVPGEEQAKVVYRLIDPEQYRGQHVLVVGGGDSALEAALAIAGEPGTHVALSYRSESFGRVKEKNRLRLQEAEQAGRVKVLLKSNVRQIDPGKVLLEQEGNSLELANDVVIVNAGGVLPTPFLKEIGIMVETKYGTA